MWGIEAGGLVLTVAMPESSCMPERGGVDQGAGGPVRRPVSKWPS